jgi:hypothetical protein
MALRSRVPDDSAVLRDGTPRLPRVPSASPLPAAVGNALGDLWNGACRGRAPDPAPGPGELPLETREGNRHGRKFNS